MSLNFISQYDVTNYKIIQTFLLSFTAKPTEPLTQGAVVGEVVIIAIGICLVVVVAVTIVIYCSCFKHGPRFGLTSPGVVGPRGVNVPSGKDNKRKIKFGDEFKKRGNSRKYVLLTSWIFKILIL